MSEDVKNEEAKQDVLEGLLGGRERPILTEFSASVLQSNNFSGVIALPLAGTPMVLAALTGAQALGLDAGGRVWLTGAVGWVAVTNGTGVSKVDVIFRIFRNTPVAGPQIFSARESAESGFDNFKTTNFVHVDINPASNGTIGPITLTAAELEPNPKPPCYS